MTFFIRPHPKLKKMVITTLIKKNNATILSTKS